MRSAGSVSFGGDGPRDLTSDDRPPDLPGTVPTPTEKASYVAKRLRLSRSRGWQLPANARSVAYPTKWANPFRPARRSIEANARAVAQYRKHLGQHPVLLSQARLELAGFDLAAGARPIFPATRTFCSRSWPRRGPKRLMSQRHGHHAGSIQTHTRRRWIEMQYLVIFKPEPGPAPDDFAERDIEEEAQARVLYQEGGLRQAWALAPPERGAAVLFEAASTDDLQRMIDSFPLIQKRYAGYQIHPLAPYPGFVKVQRADDEGSAVHS